MQNLYDVIKDSLYFNKFLINDLICVEYTCPLENEHVDIFTQYDYIIHVLSGRKTWKTIHGEWKLEAGETLYVKKGAAIIRQYLEEDFCMLGFFLPDDLLRESMLGSNKKVARVKDNDIHQFTATTLIKDDFLDGFFQSMLNYFRSDIQPHDSIIKLKLKELLLNLFYTSGNQLLVAYLCYIRENNKPSLTHIMETNFCFNLKLEDFAKLSHRSLSTFKRDFFNHYNMTPGKWILSKRLAHAGNLLINGISSISQIAFDSGFEDVSHFSRAFKTKFNASPREFRKSSG
ncbi:MAG: AraC family transcriptional regulator [Saprospiraceae bacterium]|nr:AraC family transcriptional regulator [Saprospiraceae bacterium]